MPTSAVSASPTPTEAAVPEVFARDAMIGWFRGEFAAANAIIDALCNHLMQISDGDRGFEYNSVFAAIHRRRMNWIPIINAQIYFSISEVVSELRSVASKKVEEENEKKVTKAFEVDEERESVERRVCSEESKDARGGGDHDRDDEEDSTNRFQSGDLSLEKVGNCSDQKDSTRRPSGIKITKGFIAKEPVKGHVVNVVRGLKMYENIFTDLEVSKLVDFVNELRIAGLKGELSGETFVFFNKQSKENKRELIQLGVPIFVPIKEESTSNIEPIPSVIQAVIDHLVQWRLIPESRKPNSCIINFFDEGEYSQPYLKPPHLDQPISTLVLSESTMTFGRVLVSDGHGNFKGSLVLSLNEGSLLVMHDYSAVVARHVICPSPNKRVSITFFKVRSVDSTNQIDPCVVNPLSKAMTLWQPYSMLPSGPVNYGSMDVVPSWGVLPTPLVMLAPAVVGPVVMGTRRIPRGGTGVFLPWIVGPKKCRKHLPPRARARLLALPSSTETHISENSSDLDATL